MGNSEIGQMLGLRPDRVPHLFLGYVGNFRRKELTEMAVKVGLIV